MPLIAYQRAHGHNDFPLHFAFFEQMESRGILDKADWMIDAYFDPIYARLLLSRFPQIILATDARITRRCIQFLKTSVGKGMRQVALLDKKVDAVCEAPGGRLTPVYSANLSNWWLYPRARRRAFLFHSLEAGVLQFPKLAASIRNADLFIARTAGSAENARKIGCRRVVETSDVVFNHNPINPSRRVGIAAALRVPNWDIDENYLNRVRGVLDLFESRTDTLFDLVRIEEPLGDEMCRRGYLFGRHSNVFMFSGDAMYYPFMATRDHVISCRLHTTIIALLYGNRRIFQAQVETGTNKIQQLADDLGLNSLKVRRIDDISPDNIGQFLDESVEIPEVEAVSAIARARQKNELGFDAISDFVDSL